MSDIGKLLFEGDYLEAFASGAAVWLVRNRNPNLGSLLNSEHREYYIQILHRMLHFRREHELEPLNEDIYSAVKIAQEAVHKGEYTQALFNRHMNQLTEWELVYRRLEKERLRGYRDERRDRFRYRLSDETIAFLYWLEERCRSRSEGESKDAGNLLDFVLARLKELSKALDKFHPGRHISEEAVRKASACLLLLHSANDYTERISRILIDLSGIMESFLLKSYDIDEAKLVVRELHKYIEAYLRRIYDLRVQILAELDRIRDGDLLEKLNQCARMHELELSRMPRFLRSSSPADTPEKILLRLVSYYRQQGQIDSICGRVNTSAMKVWGKLSSHLRELERRNNRCEDISRRINDLARLPEDAVPAEFFRLLVSSAAMVGDPNPWDEFTKAEPPQPRVYFESTRKTSRSYLYSKPHGGPPAQSLEESRLEELKMWMEEKFALAEMADAIDVSGAKYSGEEDFVRLMSMAKRGILGEGKSLKKIRYGLRLGKDFSSVTDGKRSLEFHEMKIRRLDENEQ